MEEADLESRIVVTLYSVVEKKYERLAGYQNVRDVYERICGLYASRCSAVECRKAIEAKFVRQGYAYDEYDNKDQADEVRQLCIRTVIGPDDTDYKIAQCRIERIDADRACLTRKGEAFAYKGRKIR